MSRWNAAICDDCWPAYCIGRGEVPFQPTRLKDVEAETCACCGASTRSGIFTRVKPEITETWADANYGRSKYDRVSGPDPE